MFRTRAATFVYLCRLLYLPTYLPLYNCPITYEVLHFTPNCRYCMKRTLRSCRLAFCEIYVLTFHSLIVICSFVFFFFGSLVRTWGLASGYYIPSIC
ncbi:hypothetical protein F5X99DRAFT_232605 [Biscogniauxia marginata]|nr:hypothetical protein F5X99DRAFT_232605 [Biscogniauxia marginata]